MRIEATDIGAEPKRAGIVAIVENPLAGVALKPCCASFLNIEQEIIGDRAEQNCRPQVQFAMHAAKIPDSAEKANHNQL